MDTITGLPAHPLVVHFSIVAIPLAAILVVLYTVIRSWRSVLAYLITGMGALIAIGVVLAASSGEALEETSEESSLLQTHAELGDQLQIIGIVFGLSLVALGLYSILSARSIITFGESRDHTVLVALMALALVTSTVATVWDVRTGHSGAKAVWSEEGEGGEGGGEADEALVPYRLL